MSGPDLTYSTDGLFVTFWPETAAGETAWREMAGQSDGTGRFLAIHRESIAAQLRAAGYSVAQRKSGRDTVTDDSALLQELGL